MSLFTDPTRNLALVFLAFAVALGWITLTPIRVDATDDPEVLKRSSISFYSALGVMCVLLFTLQLTQHPEIVPLSFVVGILTLGWTFRAGAKAGALGHWLLNALSWMTVFTAQQVVGNLTGTRVLSTGPLHWIGTLAFFSTWFWSWFTSMGFNLRYLLLGPRNPDGPVGRFVGAPWFRIGVTFAVVGYFVVAGWYVEHKLTEDLEIPRSKTALVETLEGFRPDEAERLRTDDFFELAGLIGRDSLDELDLSKPRAGFRRMLALDSSGQAETWIYLMTYGLVDVEQVERRFGGVELADIQRKLDRSTRFLDTELSEALGLDVLGRFEGPEREIILDTFADHRPDPTNIRSFEAAWRIVLVLDVLEERERAERLRERVHALLERTHVRHGRPPAAVCTFHHIDEDREPRIDPHRWKQPHTPSFRAQVHPALLALRFGAPDSVDLGEFERCLDRTISNGEHAWCMDARELALLVGALERAGVAASPNGSERLVVERGTIAILLWSALSIVAALRFRAASARRSA